MAKRIDHSPLPIDAASTNIGRLIRYGGIVLVCRYVYLGIVVPAGHATTADIGSIHLLANLHISQVLAWGVGASGIGYGLK